MSTGEYDDAAAREAERAADAAERAANQAERVANAIEQRHRNDWRDEIAIKVLLVLIGQLDLHRTNPLDTVFSSPDPKDNNTITRAEGITTWAYQYADAMLKARESTTES